MTLQLRFGPLEQENESIFSVFHRANQSELFEIPSLLETFNVDDDVTPPESLTQAIM